MNTKLLEQTFELAVYPRRDIVLVSGKGARLYDEKGREYIDCASNVGVSNIGHGHETVAKAIYEQYRSLGNCYSMFYNPVRARLAEKLAQLAPADLNRVFFCNSGTEAWEGANDFEDPGKPVAVICGDEVRSSAFPTSWTAKTTPLLRMRSPPCVVCRLETSTLSHAAFCGRLPAALPAAILIVLQFTAALVRRRTKSSSLLASKCCGLH